VLGAPLAADATLAEALAHRDPLQRAERVAQILEQSTPEDLDSVRSTIEAAPLAWGDIEYALFAGWWARFDPSAAISYCEEELRVNHPRVVAEVLRMWGRMDPQAVIDSGWLASRTIESNGLHAEYLDPLVIGWFESGKPGLENYIQSLDPTSRVTALGAYMRMLMLRDGRRAALEWTQSSPFTPDVQRLLLASGLNIVARQEPKLAVEWLDIATEKGIDVRTFVPRIARGWSHLDPKGAMEWLMTREVDPVERWRAVADVARVWLMNDEQDVENWLAARPNEAWADLVRAQAIAHHVKVNRYRVDWPNMMKRASLFTNDEQRRLQFLWNIQRWIVIEPEAASTWVAENGELLGEQIQYVDQLVSHERENILKILAAEEAGTTADES